MKELPKQFYYKKNRIQQLRGFINTVKFGSPAKAAKDAGLAHSTLTMQIQSLERDLETSLFNKARTNFTLTEDGQLLYEMSVPIIQALDGVYEKFLLDKKNNQQKQINIAGDYFAISCLLPNYIKEFNSNFPEVKINLIHLSPEKAKESLVCNEIDLGIFAINNSEPELIFKPISNYKCGLIMDKANSLANKKLLSFTDLKNHNLLITNQYLFDLSKQKLKLYDIESNISFHNYDMEILPYLLKSKTNIALAFDAHATKEELIFKPVKEFNINITYGVKIKKGRHLNNNIQSFIKLL